MSKKKAELKKMSNEEFEKYIFDALTDAEKTDIIFNAIREVLR